MVVNIIILWEQKPFQNLLINSVLKLFHQDMETYTLG